MGIFSFFSNVLRRKAPIKPQRTPQDIIAEEKRLNEAVNNPRHPAVRISPKLNKKIQVQARVKESQMASARARRAAKYNVRR